MKTFPVARMIAEFEEIGGLTAIEKAIDCFELPDGRMAQLTAKLETDKREWLKVSEDVKQAIKEAGSPNRREGGSNAGCLALQSGEEVTEYKAEQLPYPLDADYRGESQHIFELEAAAKKIVGDLDAGNSFMYLFRRFGYPRFGWDGMKQLVVYRITTPMPGLVLLVEPNLTGAFTFEYGLRDDLAQQYEDEDSKPWQDRYKRFEAWALETRGIETIHTCHEPDQDKLNRVWRKWTAANVANEFKSRNEAEQTFYREQAKITQDLLDEYDRLNIDAYQKRIPLEDRPDDSITKRVHVALCAAITDLLRPVYVRDVLINICGRVPDVENDDNAVKYAEGSGCGVGEVRPKQGAGT